MHHSTLGFCWLDPLALLILVGVIVFFIVRHCKLKKKEKELEDQLSNCCADEVDAE